MKQKEIKIILVTLVTVGIIGQNRTAKALENISIQENSTSIELTQEEKEEADLEILEEVIMETIETKEIGDRTVDKVVDEEVNEVEEANKVEEIKFGWQLEDGKHYFYDEYGNKKTGFYTDSANDTYYLDEETGEMKTGWVKVEGTFYSFQDNGVMRKGWYHDGEEWYFLNVLNGKMETGWLNDGHNWYFLDQFNGNMKTGWYNDGCDWYMLDKSTGAMKVGWYNDGYDWYMLNKSTGIMETGWYNDDENYYYLNNNGTMKTGFYNDEYGDTYYLNPTTGVMEKGWALDQDNNYHYYKNNGVMIKGWFVENGLKYYLDEKGIMRTGIVEIDSKNYRFQDNGVLIVDRWYEGGTTYSDLNGEFKVIEPSDAGSTIQYNMVRYMSSLANRESVHNRAIALHNGILENNCVYFTSELLRRAGVSIPNYIANTVQLEKQLLNRGWKKHTNLNNLKPGDIVFAGYAHAFTFMGWAGDGYAYVVDNQKSAFGSVLHKRKIFEKDSKYDTNKSTHFFRL